MNRNLLQSLAAGCLALAGLSFWAVSEESGSLGWFGADDLSTSQTLASKDRIPGLALATQRQVLNTCYRMFYFRPDTDFMLASDDQRRAVATSCERLATAAAEQNGMFSFAWMVRALAAEELGHANIVSDSLVKSRQSAPNEQWIAIPRVEIAESSFDTLSEPARTAHQADLRLLASNYTGIGVLARRYISDESFRERVTAVVETMPEIEQRTFLRRIEALIQK